MQPQGQVKTELKSDPSQRCMIFIPPLRLGFLHIPKSAGASLSRNIHEALGLPRRHVVRVAPADSIFVGGHPPAHTLVEGTPKFVQASIASFASGHVTFSELKRLKREFVFTALRDPRKRLISMFAYVRQRAMSERVLRQHPAMLGALAAQVKRADRNRCGSTLS
jgi:hypothetical protein